MKRKNLLVQFLAILMAAAMTACGNIPEGAGPSGSANTNAPKERDSVVIAIGSEPETLDPTQGWGHGNAPIVQSTLVKYTSQLTFENDLATGYELSPDGLVWTFTIRDNAFFTDGEKVTASDVAFTLETAKAARGSVDLTYMESAVAKDGATVEITLSQPTSIFLNTLASVGIVPEHAYGEEYGRSPIGSGPYKFVEWKPQEQILFTANEDYYGGAPAIKNVAVVFMSEDAALAAVQAGEVDVAYSSATLGSTQVEGYRVEAISSADNRGFTLPVLPDEGKTTESGNPVGNNVTCNLEIRQAAAYAIDRQQVADVALNGFARPAYSENDGMPWNNPQVKIDTDPDYARRLLADAGWSDTDGDGIVEKDGLKAEFTCVYPSGDSVRQAVAMAAAQQVEAVGIKINVEGVSWDELARRMFSDAVMMGWGSSIPNETYYLYRSEGALLDDFYNPEGYQSETTDSYLRAAMEALTPEEANESWKKVQWDGTTGTAMQGECPWVWIVNLDHVTYIREGLSIGEQPLHGHGHGLPLIQNLQEWAWTA
ncbi:ABC transporter substrate-binding protein [Acutalibacter sp. 1XD8-33]|uniref:ABC transporter substrate-binding protein n=1 Tax=Acutalibacter sp. 1XD8-33 TaxID=2320081 RepID=UPI000EA0C9F5|nr:ABC transporter substrate-binding protein [Acutalibacter sp. 1XD8-33]RKJ39310.1 ABC transporter substrate-binding protein [Acutalibacter sp. 1XD8-33]